MGEPGGLPSMGLHRVGHDWSDLAAAVNKKFSEYRYILHIYIYIYIYVVYAYIGVMYVVYMHMYMYKVTPVQFWSIGFESRR